MDTGMRKYNTNRHCRGVSIVEALIAAVIVGIGFVSVYTMTTVSTRMIHKATQRDNDTLSLSMIMDDLAIDRFAVADSSYYDPVSSANYNNLNLANGCDVDSADAPTGKKDRQHRRWCNRLAKKEGGMGEIGDPNAAGNTDQRKMFVRNVTITSNGYIQKYKVIGLHIEHYSRNRNQKKYTRKILHE